MWTFEKIKAMSDEELLVRGDSGRFLIERAFKGAHYFSRVEKGQIMKYLLEERGLFLNEMAPPSRFFKKKGDGGSASLASRIDPVSAVSGQGSYESMVAKAPSDDDNKKTIIVEHDFFYIDPFNKSKDLYEGIDKKILQIGKLVKEGFDVFYRAKDSEDLKFKKLEIADLNEEFVKRNIGNFDNKDYKTLADMGLPKKDLVPLDLESRIELGYLFDREFKSLGLQDNSRPSNIFTKNCFAGYFPTDEERLILEAIKVVDRECLIKAVSDGHFNRKDFWETALFTSLHFGVFFDVQGVIFDKNLIISCAAIPKEDIMGSVASYCDVRSGESDRGQYLERVIGWILEVSIEGGSEVDMLIRNLIEGAVKYDNNIALGLVINNIRDGFNGDEFNGDGFDKDKYTMWFSFNGAFRFGALDSLKYLVENFKYDIPEDFKKGSMVAEGGNVEMTKYLIEGDEFSNIRDTYGHHWRYVALNNALSAGDIKSVRYILEECLSGDFLSDIRQFIEKDRWFHPLLCAVESENFELFEYLLSRNILNCTQDHDVLRVFNGAVTSEWIEYLEKKLSKNISDIFCFSKIRVKEGYDDGSDEGLLHSPFLPLSLDIVRSIFERDKKGEIGSSSDIRPWIERYVFKDGNIDLLKYFLEEGAMF